MPPTPSEQNNLIQEIGYAGEEWPDMADRQ